MIDMRDNLERRVSAYPDCPNTPNGVHTNSWCRANYICDACQHQGGENHRDIYGPQRRKEDN